MYWNWSEAPPPSHPPGGPVLPRLSSSLQDLSSSSSSWQHLRQVSGPVSFHLRELFYYYVQHTLVQLLGWTLVCWILKFYARLHCYEFLCPQPWWLDEVFFLLLSFPIWNSEVPHPLHCLSEHLPRSAAWVVWYDNYIPLFFTQPAHFGGENLKKSWETEQMRRWQSNQYLPN